MPAQNVNDVLFSGESRQRVCLNAENSRRAETEHGRYYVRLPDRAWLAQHAERTSANRRYLGQVQALCCDSDAQHSLQCSYSELFPFRFVLKIARREYYKCCTINTGLMNVCEKNGAIPARQEEFKSASSAVHSASASSVCFPFLSIIRTTFKHCIEGQERLQALSRSRIQQL